MKTEHWWDKPIEPNSTITTEMRDALHEHLMGLSGVCRNCGQAKSEHTPVTNWCFQGCGEFYDPVDEQERGKK